MTNENDNLKAVYEQICQADAAISDFRAKLLALLPIASGAGIFLLLKDDLANVHLPAVGAFGAIVSLGLFLYELRGIQVCNGLVSQGLHIENQLLADDELALGVYTGRPKSIGIVSTTSASIVVYSVVVAAWVYVAVANMELPGKCDGLGAQVLCAGNNCRVRSVGGSCFRTAAVQPGLELDDPLNSLMLRARIRLTPRSTPEPSAFALRAAECRR